MLKLEMRDFIEKHQEYFPDLAKADLSDDVLRCFENIIEGYQSAIGVLVGHIYEQQRTGEPNQDYYLEIHAAIDKTLAQLKYENKKLNFYDIKSLEESMRQGVALVENSIEDAKYESKQEKANKEQENSQQ